jgi:hypothetical protein
MSHSAASLQKKQNSIKSNFPQFSKPEENQDLPFRCPHSPGVYQSVSLDAGTLRGQSIRLNCNSWDCPICNQRKFMRLRARVFNGAISTAQDLGQYDQKFLTLTCPGKEFRATYTPAQAVKIMSDNWNKLRTAIKKFYGDFYYFRVMEKQQDGFPHYHVLLVGKNISNIGILRHIQSLWCERYLMGVCSPRCDYKRSETWR